MKRKCIAQGLKQISALEAFTVPVLIDGNSGEVYRFKKKPYWGRIYYGFFGEMLDAITNNLN